MLEAEDETRAEPDPLPYAPLGIDLPRTFAYKMSEQLRAREWMRGHPGASAYTSSERFTMRATTRALDASGYESYKEGYASEDEVLNTADSLKNLKLSAGNFEYTGTYLSQASSAPDLQGKRVKPFLPGLYLNTQAGYRDAENSPYHPDKIAGVDAVGLTLGSIATDSFAGRFHNAFGEAVAGSLDEYYKMDKSDIVPGLDEKGLPAFYSVGSGIKSSLEGNYRLTRGDIERATVLIPNISMIRKGDLLVRYDVAGEPHIGIVAGLGWTEMNGPSWTADARDWWSKVYVVSVRRGYRTVSLGSWGNSSTVFGGFTASPESYQIRRLLVKRDDAAQQKAEPPAWELVDEVAVRNMYTYYSVNYVPRIDEDVNTNTRNDNDSTTASDLKIALNDIKNGIMRNGMTDRFYFKMLPPTTFLNTPAKELPLLQNDSGVKKFRVTCLTGWRKIYKNYRYHTGIDISDRTNAPAEFVAPEDGIFYIYDSTNSIYDDKTSSMIPVTNLDDIGPSSETLSISSYAESTYGKVGVLITNPNSPRDGRVYLFCHMENDKDRQELSGGSGTPVSTFYNTKWVKYPNTPANFITVKAGDAIGLTGGGPVEQNIEDDTFKRLYPVHLHVEVYEYFETIEGADVASSPNTGWQRVDPLSVFLGKAKYETLVKLNEVKITSGDEGNPESDAFTIYLSPTYKTKFTTEEANASFKKWPIWERKEEEVLSWE